MNEKEALHKAAAYCSTAERCISEVKEKLVGWQIDEKVTNEIIQYLIKEKFIDETRYVNGFVSDKIRFNKWGKIKISYALQQKKIKSELIQSALNEIDEDKYVEILSDLINNKRKTIKSKDKYEEQNKLIRFALSRGFSFDEIQRLINNK